MSDFSIVTYTADGTPNVQYAVPFDFISRDHVLVLTAYDKSTGSYGQQLLPTTDFLWVDDTTIEVIALAAGTVFSIVRQTPKDQPLVNWVAGGGALTAEELRLSSLQILFIVQENADRGLATAADADAALEAVGRVVAYDLVANVAAIPANPKDNTYIEVLDTTGIQNFSPLTGMPPGFIGDAGLKARLRYVASGASWRWIDYASINPEERYIRKTAISTSVTSTSTGTVAASAAVKTAMDKAKEAEAMTTALIPAINQNTTTANEALSTANAAMPKAGGTFTGDVNFGTTTATKLPVGTTAQRPTGATGLVRFNTTINQYEGYNGTAWSPIGGGAKVSATAPSPATDGMQWYDLNDGRTYVYVNDGNSSQWVDASPPVAGPIASETLSGTVELATAAETFSRTDATRAVTPAALNSTFLRNDYYGAAHGVPGVNGALFVNDQVKIGTDGAGNSVLQFVDDGAPSSVRSQIAQYSNGTFQIGNSRHISWDVNNGSSLVLTNLAFLGWVGRGSISVQHENAGHHVTFRASAAGAGLFYTTSSAGGWQGVQVSDKRIKSLVPEPRSAHPHSTGLALVDQLQPVRFTYHQDRSLGLPAAPRWGFYAQDVQAVLPEAVQSISEPDIHKDGTPFEDALPDLLAFEEDAPIQLIAVLTSAVQELKAANAALEARITALEGGTL